MDPDTAIDAIRRTTDTLGGIGVEHWLDCGSLLGAIREQRIMPHDLDVDFGTFEWTRHEEINQAMQKAGFTPYRTHGTPEHGYEQRYELNDVRVDIFYFYDEGSTCWQGSWVEDELLVSRFDKELVATTEPFTFQGVTVPVPKEPQRMLEARYGDWRTPKETWDYATDPKCLVR